MKKLLAGVALGLVAAVALAQTYTRIPYLRVLNHAEILGNLTVSGTCTGCGSGGTPGGANTQVQFNDSSAFGGDAGLTYNKTTDTLIAGGNTLSTDGILITSPAAQATLLIDAGGSESGDQAYLDFGAGSTSQYRMFGYDSSAATFRNALVFNVATGTLAIGDGTNAVSINGVGSTDFARLSQNNAFTAAGTATAGFAYGSSGTPVIGWNETDAAANAQRWIMYPNAGAFSFEARSDDGSTSTSAFAVSRSGSTVTTFAIGGTAVTGNGGIDMTPASGTFTASFDVACTTTPTATFDWQRLGNIVSVWMVSTSGFTCTGDSASFGTSGTPIPAALRPSSVDVCVPANTIGTDNGTAVFVGMVFTTTGDVSMTRYGATPGGCSSGTSWTASGTRTLGATLSGYRVTYGLGNP